MVMARGRPPRFTENVKDDIWIIEEYPEGYYGKRREFKVFLFRLKRSKTLGKFETYEEAKKFAEKLGETI